MGAALLHTPVADWRFSEHARITATKFMLQGLREQKNPGISRNQCIFTMGRIGCYYVMSMNVLLTLRQGLLTLCLKPEMLWGQRFFRHVVPFGTADDVMESWRKISCDWLDQHSQSAV